MTSPQTLRRLTVESLAIVGSILLAFAIDAWWARSEEGARRDALMRNLRAEITANIRALERVTELQAVHAQDALRYVDILSGDEPSPPVDELRALRRRLLVHPVYHPSFGVLDVLIQSGDLILLQNPELQAGLANLKAFVSTYTNNQKRMVAFTTSDAALFDTGTYLYPWKLPKHNDPGTTGDRDELETASKIVQGVYGVYEAVLDDAGLQVLAKFREIHDLIP